MFKEIAIGVIVFFTITLLVSIYAHAVPEYFAMVTRLVTYIKENFHYISDFCWGLIFEWISAFQEWIVKITISILG